MVLLLGRMGGGCMDQRDEWVQRIVASWLHRHGYVALWDGSGLWGSARRVGG